MSKWLYKYEAYTGYIWLRLASVLILCGLQIEHGTLSENVPGNMCYYLSIAQYLANEQKRPSKEVVHVLVAIRIRMTKHQHRSPWTPSECRSYDTFLFHTGHQSTWGPSTWTSLQDYLFKIEDPPHCFRRLPFTATPGRVRAVVVCAVAGGYQK